MNGREVVVTLHDASKQEPPGLTISLEQPDPAQSVA